MKKLFFAFVVLAFMGTGCVMTDSDVRRIDVGNINKMYDFIVVNQPHPGDVVTSPLFLTGEAVGTWYFEASFPVELQDMDGNVIAQGHAEAQGDWMTEDFVPFTAMLSFTVPSGVTGGVLYLRNDNPSGLPENDKDVHFSVQF